MEGFSEIQRRALIVAAVLGAPCAFVVAYAALSSGHVPDVEADPDAPLDGKDPTTRREAVDARGAPNAWTVAHPTAP
jgi:hypothetical protein